MFGKAVKNSALRFISCFSQLKVNRGESLRPSLTFPEYVHDLGHSSTSMSIHGLLDSLEYDIP